MIVSVGGKEMKMIEVSKLIELLEVWKNRKHTTNYVAISDAGYMCLIEKLRNEYDQFGVIHLGTEKTVVFDEGF